MLAPGGRALLVVDSLVEGMAHLAEQHLWAELADVPAADVVLVPYDEGGIRRCFWPEALASLVCEAGLEVEWLRPRTVLAASTVERALAEDPAAMPRLVRTEAALAMRRTGEVLGARLVVSCRRPG